jgi:L,D-transpeptidase YbiS
MKCLVDVNTQTLALHTDANVLIKSYAISTAKKGVGQQFGSEQTPLGKHIVRAKIGRGAPLNTVFVGRRPTGEIYTPALGAECGNRDWILTRILWLSGCEPGVNRLGSVDTMRRYVYIHGGPDDRPVGVPNSRGCIRMRNADIIELFELLPVYSEVHILR